MSGLFGSLGDISFSSGPFAEAFWPTALITAASLLDSEGDMPWTSTEEGAHWSAEQNMALQAARIEAEKQMQAESIAAMNARAAQEVAAMLKQAKMQSLGTGYSTNARMEADILAEKVKAARGFPEVVQGAGSDLIQALLGRGTLAQKGFSDIASTLASYKV